MRTERKKNSYLRQNDDDGCFRLSGLFGPFTCRVLTGTGEKNQDLATDRPTPLWYENCQTGKRTGKRTGSL